MHSDYDRKFEELKSYIPFLEKIIKCLSSNLPSNPRQTQLDKMRSLRNLLLNSKRRMKMENLLKCEQILINLYKNVELRESISGTKSDSVLQSYKDANLEEVRNKLKSVAIKMNEDTPPRRAKPGDKPKSSNIDVSIDKKRDTDVIIYKFHPSEDKGEVNTKPVKTVTENDSVSAENKEEIKNKIAIDGEKIKGKAPSCDVKKICPLETTNRNEDQNIYSKKVADETKSHDEITKSKCSETVNESFVNIEAKSETLVNHPSTSVIEECSQKATIVEKSQNCFKKQDAVEIPFVKIEETAKQETVSKIQISKQALIADLDHDTTKNVTQNEITQEVSLDNVLAIITTIPKTTLDIKHSSSCLTKEFKKYENFSAASVCNSNKTTESDTDKRYDEVCTSKDITQKSEKTLEQSIITNDNNASKLAVPDSTINITNLKEVSVQESVSYCTNELSYDITSSISGIESLKSSVIQSDSIDKLLSHMSTKAMNIPLKRFQSLSNTRDTMSNISAGSRDRIEFGDESNSSTSTCSLQDIAKGQETKPLRIHSKIAFENDSDSEKSKQLIESFITDVKLEPQSYDKENELKADTNSDVNVQIPSSSVDNIQSSVDTGSKADIFELPHFKVNFTKAGLKEYVCCINNNNHYKSTLLISFKKHVQMKHPEKWDGYCCLCKVIVTTQGMHGFFTCLQHFLDKHVDNFLVLEKEVVEPTLKSLPNKTPKPFLTVRSSSELISMAVKKTLSSNPSPLPIIESVRNHGTPEPKDVMYSSTDLQPEQKEYSYEEAQADIMSQKNGIILDAMMKHEKLVNVFKCAGRFCSFTTDSAHDALLHASAHSRVGGQNALKCAYCDFDSLDKAIDLITHVFKTHGCCQYACGVCFYRAAASQLVSAHIARSHPDKPTTILKAPFVTEECCKSTVLSRTDAVPYYICNHEEENGETCKFKTYILRKFCEHLNIKHSTVAEHKCFICQDVLSKDAYVVSHLKTHGLKLYQCVWCVYGAENENELLAHASSKHPSKQPQAYLRVIINKEGTSDFRVLPLAHLNKSNTPYIDIVCGVKENPEREAERSVDLEKLIGITTPIDSMVTTSITSKCSTDQNTLVNPPLQSPSELEPKAVTPIAPFIPEVQTTPIIKPNSVEISSSKSMLNKPDSISLDSDDEDVISSGDLGQEMSSTSSTKTIESIKKHKHLVYMCSKCKIISKNKNIFKIHLGSCFRFNTDIPCAYCSFKGTKQKILAHYTKDHTLKLGCVKCPEMFSSISQANAKPVVGRKESVEINDKTEEPPAKVIKYGPQDVDQLAIYPRVTLTASRIIAHLKMHDVRLYACTLCSYYHFRRQVVEKHLNEVHKGGNILIVREKITSPQTPVAPVPTAPTMELKPWQCGLCEFKSLLRPEVVEHCSTGHQSKMQFKCAYCAFRTSNSENVTKHQSLSHQGKPEELFYYFYREGSLPNQDGIPFWQAQINKFNIPKTRVKTQVLKGTLAKVETPERKSSTPNVELNIVKQEVPETVEDTVEELCKRFGEFCEPNGLKYKCSLCKIIINDTKEAMQSHLYEELLYRKWGCSICFYKAFHKRGLNEHMQSEHRQNRDPVELTVDVRVETWVAKLLEYQESIIERSKNKLAQQPRQPVVQKTTENKAKPSSVELEKQFGPPVNLPRTAPAPPNRKVARKYTTKLPNYRTVAKKSTTKVPYQQEYSFYGTKPRLDNLENITTRLPVFNKFVEFPYVKLQETFNMNPNVLVEKLCIDDLSE